MTTPSFMKYSALSFNHITVSWGFLLSHWSHLLSVLSWNFLFFLDLWCWRASGFSLQASSLFILLSHGIASMLVALNTILMLLIFKYLSPTMTLLEFQMFIVNILCDSFTALGYIIRISNSYYVQIYLPPPHILYFLCPCSIKGTISTHMFKSNM